MPARFRQDYRTEACRAAAARVLAICDAGGRVLGLGGGPLSVHAKIINLNIEAFENVALVGDAHKLPLASDSIDGVHCEAVFEHLRDPADAAAEMFRVMKPGALAYVCTPFMQAYHGYPSHFQNFTLAGHRHLFERAGFEVLEAGIGVGPSEAISGAVASFLSLYAPRLVRWPLRAMWFGFSTLFVRPLDHWLGQRENAHMLASTTYVLITKPQL